jgi:hypothetical protein
MEGCHQNKRLCLSCEGELANLMTVGPSNKCHLDFSLETEFSGRTIGGSQLPHGGGQFLCDSGLE